MIKLLQLPDTNYFTVGYCPECGSIYIIDLEDIESYYYGNHVWTCPTCKTMIVLDDYYEQLYKKEVAEKKVEDKETFLNKIKNKLRRRK